MTDEIIETEIQVRLVTVEMTCGHMVYMTERTDQLRRHDHRSFFCTICGQENCYKETKQNNNIVRLFGGKCGREVE